VGVAAVDVDRGVAADLLHARGPGGEQRDARAERLERDEAEALVQAGVDEEGRLGVERGELLGVGPGDDADPWPRASVRPARTSGSAASPASARYSA
jgi:hypothetical protein